MSKSKFNPMFIVKEILDIRGVKWRNEPTQPSQWNELTTGYVVKPKTRF